jgi:hypothetical protein
MDIFSEETNISDLESRGSTIQEVVDKFSSEKSNHKFMSRFKLVLKELIKIPIESPAELISEINRIIDTM